MFKRRDKFWLIAGSFLGIIVCLFLFIYLTQDSYTYDTHVAHPNIVELAARLYNQKFTNKKLTEEEISWIEKGAIEEDTPTRWLNHFYDPIYNRGIWFGQQELSAKEWHNNGVAQKNFSLGDYSLNRALTDYRAGSREEAFKGLGHLIHLLSDMTVPAHTRDDIHVIGDSYEQFVKNNWQTIASVLPAPEYNPISDLKKAFDDLANYSNNNFYSDDTIENKKYLLPKIIGDRDGKYILSKLGDKKFKILYNKKSIFSDDKIDLSFYKIDDVIRVDYSKLLISKAIGYSAGAIKLFLDEAGKNNIGNSGGSRVGLKGYADLVVGKAINGAESIYNYLESKLGGSQTAYGGETPVLTNQNSGNNTQIINNTNSASSKQDKISNLQLSSLPKPSAGGQVSPQPLGLGLGQTQNTNVQTPNTNSQTSDINNQTSNSNKQPSVIDKPTVVAPIIYYSGGGGGGGTTQNSNNPANSAGTEHVAGTTQNTDTTTTASDHLVVTSTSDLTTTTTQNTTSTTSTTDITTSTCVDVQQCLSSTPTTTTSTVFSTSTASTTDLTTTTTQNTTSTTSTPDHLTTSTTSTLDITTSTTSTPDITTSTSSTEEVPTSTEPIVTSTPPVVEINEIAWAGTAARYANDEWLELYNNTSDDIDLRYWKILVSGHEINWTTSSVKDPIIKAHGYFLLERNSDEMIPDISANIVYTSDYGFNDAGEKMELFNDIGEKVDEVDCSSTWFAGDNINYRSMEKIDPAKDGNDKNNWQSSFGLRMQGRSYAGGDLVASPKQPNQGFIVLRNTQLEDNLVLQPKNNPYVLADYTVPAGKTLNIEPGVVIKAQYNQAILHVDGTLIASGTIDNPIIFTSGRDYLLADNKLSALVGNWSGNEPQAKDWAGIWFSNGAVGNLDNVKIRFAGFGMRPPNAGWWTPNAENVLRADKASLNVSNSQLENNGGTLIYLDNASGTIKNTNFDSGSIGLESQNSYLDLSDSNFKSFTDTRGALYVHGRWPKISNLTLTNNVQDKVYLEMIEVQNGEEKLDKDLASQAYFTYLTILPGASLQIDPGVDFKLAEYGGITVDNGILNVNGTDEEPVLIHPYIAGTRWGQLIFNNSNSVLNSAYLSDGNQTGSYDENTNGMVLANNSNLVLNNVLLENPRRPGNSLQAVNSTVTISNSLITDTIKLINPWSPSYGIKVRSGEVYLNNNYLSQIQIGIGANNLATLHFNSMSSSSFNNVDNFVEWPNWLGF